MSDAIQTLLSRVSSKLVVAPGPNAAQLDEIMRCAMAAPDHGAVRPWRFKIIQGEAVPTFAQYCVEQRQQSANPVAEHKAKAGYTWLSQAPLIIAVASQIHHERIPDQELMLATGGAVMNILNAAHALGFGAFWSTGLGTYIPDFQKGLGFDPQSYQYLGMIVIGSYACKVPCKLRPNWQDFTQQWTAPIA